MKKLVLFDLDGTLVNAGGCGRTALTKAIEELYGVKPEFDHSPAARIRTILPLSIRSLKRAKNPLPPK